MGLTRDSEKFDYRDENHLNEIIEGLKSFIRGLFYYN